MNAMNCYRMFTSQRLFWICLLTTFWSFAVCGQEGLSCVNPQDITGDLPVNGSHTFTVDTSDGDKYYGFTASEAGTFEISTCSNPTYLLVYDDACNLLHEQGMSSCGTSLHAVELKANETIKIEFDSRNNVAGFESTTATAHFQEEVDGQEPTEAVALSEGINTMTRYLGNQYFGYQATEPGSLTIRTCNEGNPVDGTELRLYDNELLENLLVDNTWCSNDPDGDLAQSVVEYDLVSSETVILEAEPAFFLYDSYEFEVQFEPAGNSCEDPIAISELGIYNVDNSSGHQWFAFTAPETMEIAITTGAASQEWGYVDLGNFQDTRVFVYDGCGGNLVAFSDDTQFFSFGRSYTTLEVTAGTTYLIEWDDQFVKDPFQCQFEIFEAENAFVGAIEEEAVTIDVGVHRALLNYKNEHWFKYTFPSDGVLIGVNRDELEARVIPSYQMLYGDNGLDLELPYKEEFEVTNYGDDEWTETNFMYEGLAGEEVLIRVKDVGSAYFHRIGNRDFELAFFAGAVLDDLCYYESEFTEGVHQVNSADGDQKYKFTAAVAGTHVFSVDDNPSMLIRVYDECFGDPLYSKYNNFYFEKEMVVGEELYFVFFDEYGGACEFDISIQNPSCENPIRISELGIYDVDNTDGDQWFEFTAPETMEIAITTGPASQEWGGINLSNGQDTWFSVYDACNGSMLAQSDDSGVLGFRRSYATLNVVAGTSYFIQWRDQFITEPFHYQFEIFDVPEVFGNATQEDAEVIEVGVHRALLNYKNQHWYKYTFPSNGVLVAVNRDELEGRVIPSYQMFYGDNGLDLELPNKEEIAIWNWSYDEPTETNFMYEGMAGEEVLIRVEEVAGIHFHRIGNRDFELAFFDEAAYNDLCYSESGLDQGVHEINSSNGDQKYKYTATQTGTYIFSADDNPSMLVSIYDQCFGDPIYTKYNDFYFEKEMEVGEEVHIVFFDEYGGTCDFEIVLESSECEDQVTVEETACDTYDFNDELLTESGSYQATLTNYSGCDSLVLLTLTILESTSTDETVEACESYEWNNVVYDISGTYQDLFTSSAGCDSVAILNLTILDPTSSTTNAEVCEYYEWNGNTYVESGVYEEVFTNKAGCDSLAILDLTILKSSSSESFVETCESYEWNDEIYDTSGTYQELFTNSAGCDSVATLNLTILDPSSSATDAEVCEYYEWNGVSYLESGTYEYISTNSRGCDSVATLTLTILESTISEQIVRACASYEWNDMTYSNSGTYEEVLTNASGCDSTATLHLTIVETSTGEKTIEACGPYEWNNVRYSTSGLYQETFMNAAGCDSIATLDLTINETYDTIVVARSCDGYEFGGLWLTESGSYSQTLVSSQNCDSLVNLDLTIYTSSSVEIIDNVCEGDEYFFPDGSLLESITSDTSQLSQLTGIHGCDSLVTSTLTVQTGYDITRFDTLFCGESYAFGTAEIKDAGDYLGIFESTQGCDSVVHLVLTDSVLSLNVQVDLTNQTLTSSAYGVSYQWLDCNNGMAAIEGADRKVLNVDREGNYAVSISNGRCTDTTACYSTIILEVQDISPGIKIGPNPTTGLVDITSNNDLTGYRITVMGLGGEVVSEQLCDRKNSSVSINGKTGLYLIIIQSEDWIETHKIYKH